MKVKYGVCIVSLGTFIRVCERIESGDVKIWQAGSSLKLVSYSLKLVSTCRGHARAVWAMCCLKRRSRHETTRLGNGKRRLDGSNLEHSKRSMLTKTRQYRQSRFFIPASPDQKSIAYAGDDQFIRLSNVNYDDSVALRGHKSSVYKVLF